MKKNRRQKSYKDRKEEEEEEVELTSDDDVHRFGAVCRAMNIVRFTFITSLMFLCNPLKP